MILYDGHFKLLPMNTTGGFQPAFDERILSITRVIDLVFLHGHSKPTLCILHESDDRTKKIETFVIEVRDKEIIAGPWKHTNIDITAHTLISVDGAGGVAVLGESSITYYGGSNNNNSVYSTAITPCQVNSYSLLTSTVTASTRYLLGDTTRRLYVLELSREVPAGRNQQDIFTSSSSSRTEEGLGPVTGLSIDVVGRTNVASALTCLPGGHVYVGSCYGDSQLIQLSASPVSPSGSSDDDSHQNSHTSTGKAPIDPNFVVIKEKLS